MRALLLVLLVGCADKGGGDPQDSSSLDEDGDGYVVGDDCDDSDPNVNAGSTEVCDDEDTDEDCDGLVDDDDPDVDISSYRTFYRDRDGDGAGSSRLDPVAACDAPSEQWVLEPGDCNDDDAGVGFVSEDQDCDGSRTADDCDDTVGALNYRDDDGDGHSSCEGDCDDLDAGLNLLDADGDGYTSCGEDCDDTTNTVNPDATEVCDDGIDQRCNGLVDCEDADCATAPTCYESDCGDGEDNDDDGWVDCTDDECAGLGDCRVLVSQVHGGTLDHSLYHRSSVRDVDIHGTKSTFQICHSATPNGGTYTFSVSTMQPFNSHRLDSWSLHNEQMVARDVWGTVRIYENSNTVQCDWSLDTFQLDRASTLQQSTVASDLARYGFATTGACGLDSYFLPSFLVPQSGWALLDTTSANPWYAAAHSTQGSSLAATVLRDSQNLSSYTTSYGTAWDTGFYNFWGNAQADVTRSTRTASWEIASPRAVAGQPYRLEIPCGDPSISPAAWYMDADGDGYGDPARSVTACLAPSAYVADASDTDDTDSSTH